MRVRDAHDVVQIGLPEADVELVFGIEREDASDKQSAAGAERQPLDVRVLRSIRLHAVGLGRDGNIAHVAHGNRRDAPGGGEIPLHQHRRHRQHVGDVVESVARVIGGQERGHVDVEIEEVVDRVRVLGPVEPAQRRPAWFGLRGRGGVEPRFDRGGERRELRRFGPRQALRRHRSDEQFARHTLEHGSIAARRPGSPRAQGTVFPSSVGRCDRSRSTWRRRPASPPASRALPRVRAQQASCGSRASAMPRKGVGNRVFGA